MTKALSDCEELGFSVQVLVLLLGPLTDEISLM